MDIVKTLVAALDGYETDRDRQVEIGASSVGGCRRQAYHIIHQTPTTNHDTETLAALLGTAIHALVADALAKYDLFGEDYLIEQEFSNERLKGHVDFYSRSRKLVADWKTVTLKKIADGWKPTAQQKMQVNLYAYLMIEAGYEVERVALVAIPRDGKKRDIVAWESDYDPELALKGFTWLKEIYAMQSPPAPERNPVFFCRDYCQFYDESGEIGCQGK